MFPILSLLGIFIFIIILFLVSLKVIELIFSIKVKVKTYYLKEVFTASSLFLWFCLGAIAIILVASLLVKLPLAFETNTRQTAKIILEDRDCQKLLDKIDLEEQQIAQIKNHRYLEKTASPFTIDLEYQQEAAKLNTLAEQYLNLNLTKNGQIYRNNIAQSLQTQAQLFQDRTKMRENSRNIPKIDNILKQMDRTIEQRKNMISTIKKQCFK